MTLRQTVRQYLIEAMLESGWYETEEDIYEEEVWAYSEQCEFDSLNSFYCLYENPDLYIGDFEFEPLRKKYKTMYDFIEQKDVDYILKKIKKELT